jgi:hypothetical protein
MSTLSKALRELRKAEQRYDGLGGDRGWGNDYATELALRDAEHDLSAARSAFNDAMVEARGKPLARAIADMNATALAAVETLKDAAA